MRLENSSLRVIVLSSLIIMGKFCFRFLPYLFLIYLLLACFAMAATNITADQSSLLALKDHITSDPYQILAKNWSAGSSSVCEWIGVTCSSRYHRVTALNISNMDLTGTISPHLGNLFFLVSLDLSTNNFHGNLPGELSRLWQLQILNLTGNNFSGEIPSWFGSLHRLRIFLLGENSFTGFIPPSIFNISKLEDLRLSFNSLQGPIPVEVGNLHSLKILEIGYNQLSGSVPIQIFNISSLEKISLTNNGLSGRLPNNMCHRLQRLRALGLSSNMLHGAMPSSISQCSGLQYLNLSSNNFHGAIPKEIGKLEMLERLYLDFNNFSGAIPEEIGNLDTLEELSLEYNNFEGEIPTVFGNLTTLRKLALGQNKLSGSVPLGIFNISSLEVITLYNNSLSGRLPDYMCRHLPRLNFVGLTYNNLSGGIPSSISQCSQLQFLDLSVNHFGGDIPKEVGNLKMLQVLYLDYNNFKGPIFSILSNCSELRSLGLTANNIGGVIPEDIGKWKALNELNLSFNNLTGKIPRTLGNLTMLRILSMRNNTLTGISHNSLFGSIPMSFEKLQSLKYFNVSFNHLSGEIPHGGPFSNFPSESFAFNEALCGAQRLHVPPCSTRSNKKKKVHPIVIILPGIAAFMCAIALVFVYLRYRKKDNAENKKDLLLLGTQERISYYELFQATDGYDKKNLLGTGSYGSVYKGILHDRRIVAVKVFNIQYERASKSFDVECIVLRQLRHRNLTKVISSCSNPDFKALVLEFMINGSLEQWLYSDNYFLDAMERLNIMIDVAHALDYLHSGYSTPVVHCDLKPSNILLDQDMVARVSDFGIAKLLGHEDSKTYTKTLATLGYLAPEYGLEGLVSTKCDVYSYGILLMEVFTRKKPNDDMFEADLNLKAWVHNSILNPLAPVIDANLLSTSGNCSNDGFEYISSIMEVALNCTKESAKERCTMAYVIVALEKIKLQLQPYYTRT